MSVLNLNSSNFDLVGSKQNGLWIYIQGVLLVFYKSRKSVPCENIEPLFYSLAAVEKRATFAALDLDVNREVVSISRNSTTPIQAVPLFILYINKRPGAKFSGEVTAQRLRDFITRTFESLRVETDRVCLEGFNSLHRINVLREIGGGSSGSDFYGNQRRDSQVFMPDIQPPRHMSGCSDQQVISLVPTSTLKTSRSSETPKLI